MPRHKAAPQLSARTLKDLAELATVEYSVTKIVSYKDVAWYGDRKILFETAATVKAGIDLNELTDGDIQLEDDKAVTVTLPRPKILLFNMKPENMREIFNESGVLRSDFSNEEKDGLLSQGEKDIRTKVARMDILAAGGAQRPHPGRIVAEEDGLRDRAVWYSRAKGGGHEKNTGLPAPDHRPAGHPAAALQPAGQDRPAAFAAPPSSAAARRRSTRRR